MANNKLLGDLPGVRLFLQTLASIRDPKTGCPWDLAQSHESLMKYFHEELHEFEEALKDLGPQSSKTWDELGDVLLQIGLHARLGEEAGLSSFDEIARLQAEKLISRHPHVFDPDFPRFKTPAEVSAAWEQIKAHAKNKLQMRVPGNSQPPSAEIQPASTQANSKAAQVSAVPKMLPSLLRSSRIGEKAAAFAFDWPEHPSVLAKIHEEIKELDADQMHPEKAKEELGDLLFACAQYARKRGWDPEQVLEAANEKFCRRFEAMENLIEKKKLKWQELSLEQLEEQWVEAKKQKA